MYKQGHEGKSSSPPADTTHDRDSENSFLQGAKQLTKTRNKKNLAWLLTAESSLACRRGGYKNGENTESLSPPADLMVIKRT